MALGYSKCKHCIPTLQPSQFYNRPVFIALSQFFCPRVTILLYFFFLKRNVLTHFSPPFSHHNLFLILHVVQCSLLRLLVLLSE